MSDALGNSILLIAIPLYIDQLHSPLLATIPEPLLVGILISIYGIVFSSLQPVTGAISDRISRRKPFILGGLAIMGLGILAFIFATNVLDLVVIRILQGIGVAFTVSPALALLTISTDKETRGGSMGIYTSMRMVGFAIGPLLGGFLQVTYGFNAVFIAGAAAVFVAVVLVQWLVHEKPVDVSKKPSKRMRLFDPKVFTGPLIALGIGMFLMSGAFSMITTLEPQFNARPRPDGAGFWHRLQRADVHPVDFSAAARPPIRPHRPQAPDHPGLDPHGPRHGLAGLHRDHAAAIWASPPCRAWPQPPLPPLVSLWPPTCRTRAARASKWA